MLQLGKEAADLYSKMLGAVDNWFSIAGRGLETLDVCENNQHALLVSLKQSTLIKKALK